MTTTVGPGAIDTMDERLVRHPRAWEPARLFARIARSLWMRDRAVAELRWAAITLATMGVLGLLAKLIDPAGADFDLAVLVAWPAALLAVAAGWSRIGPLLVQHRPIRMMVGPAVLGVAVVAAGPVDIATLAMPPTAPLVVLALSYAAITVSYPLAAGITAGAAIASGIAHAVQAPGVPAANLVSDEYVVRVAVVLFASTGLYLVVRIAGAAEDRAARLAARSRRRVDDLERLERIVRRFDGSRRVREVIQAVVDDVSRAFEIALVSIYLPDGERRLSMVGVAGYHSPFHVIDVGVGVIGRAAATRTTQYVPDVLADPDYRAARDDVRNEVAIPIVHDDELLGVINFEGTLRRPLGARHIALGEMLGRAMAASLRSARLDEERRSRLHAIERVLAVSRGVLSDLDRRRTIDGVVDAAVDLLSADRVYVAGRTHDGGYRIEGDSADPRDGTWRPRLLDDVDAAAMTAVADGSPAILGSPGSGGSEAPSIMALPIRVDDKVTAVLVATRPSGGVPFRDLDLGIGDLLATHIGIALRNADRHATVSDAAVRDPLTGLLNRRHFDEAVETAFATARRTGAPLSLIVLDLDRFFAINNEHGHAVGDAVLRRVGRAMTEAVRTGDTVARYGGEEFVIIAPGTHMAEAIKVAERVRAAIAAASDGTGGDGATLAITASAGVASLLGDELDGRALFRAADSALLAAKRAGRDRVVAV